MTTPQPYSFECRMGADGWCNNREHPRYYHEYPHGHHQHHQQGHVKTYPQGGGRQGGSAGGGYTQPQQTPLTTTPEQQQQQQYQQDYSEYQTGYEEYYGQQDYGYGYGYGENYEQQLQQQPLQTQAKEKPLSKKEETLSPLAARFARFSKMNDVELAQVAPIKYLNVAFEAVIDFTPGSMIAKDNTVIDGGELTYSRRKQNLTLMSATCEPHIYQKSLARNDLVQQLEVSITGNYPKRLLLSFPTIKKIDKEGFRNGADHVNFTIPQGVLKPDKPYTMNIERNVTNGMVGYATVFEDPSPDNMSQSISNRRDGTSLLPLNHAVVHYWNVEHATDGLAKTEKDIIPGLGMDILMKTTDVNKFLEIAQKGVSNKISLGNVTSDIAMVLSPIEPIELQQFNLNAVAQGKPQKAFAGFADPAVMWGKNFTLEQKNGYLNTTYHLDVTIKAKYVKLDADAELF